MAGNGIVVNGQANLLRDPRTRVKLAEAVRKIRSRYAQLTVGTGVFRRIVLWFRMQKDIRAATAKIAPPSACYLKR